MFNKLVKYDFIFNIAVWSQSIRAKLAVFLREFVPENPANNFFSVTYQKAWQWDLWQIVQIQIIFWLYPYTKISSASEMAEA